MNDLGLDEAQVNAAIGHFNRGKQADYDLTQAVLGLRRVCVGRPDLLRTFLEIEMRTAIGGSDLRGPARPLLLRVAALIGVSGLEFARLETVLRIRHRARGNRGDAADWNRPGARASRERARDEAQQERRAAPPPSRMTLPEAYEVLGVSAKAGDPEVTKAYRRQLSRHHPDKLKANGLPESMLGHAKQRTQQIIEAWEVIREQRNLGEAQKMTTDKSVLIAPSILSANFACLGAEVDAVLEAGADLIHFDVMDNHYVPNLTMGPMVCEALRKHGVTAPIDVHLMVKPVDRLIVDFARAGASWISFHPEASEHVDRSIHLIREQGCRAGLVLNPASPLDWLDYTLDSLDFVLLMSVNPGFGGQSFLPQVLPKIQAVRERINASGRAVRLEVDGGIKAANIAQVVAAGADTIVAGSAIFGSEDYAATLRELRAAIETV